MKPFMVKNESGPNTKYSIGSFFTSLITDICCHCTEEI